MNSKQAVQQAIFHYQSESKKYKQYPENDYTKPLIQGLEQALKEIDKYHEILNKIKINY